MNGKKTEKPQKRKANKIKREFIINLLLKARAVDYFIFTQYN